MGNLFVDTISNNKIFIIVNIGLNRIPIKIIDEINNKLKVNEAKSKFMPNLIKQKR